LEPGGASATRLETGTDAEIAKVGKPVYNPRRIMHFNTDRIVGVSAILISVATLFVVVYQAQLQREQMELERRATAASVMPYLMVVTTINNEGVFMNLRNTGIGPARIDSVRVLHGGKAIPGDAVDFYTTMRQDPELPTDIDQLKPGRLVPAGEWVRMLGSGAANRNKMLVELLRLFEIAELQKNMYEEYDKQLAEQAKTPAVKPALKKGEVAPPILLPREKAVLEVTYSSVFGEEWVLRSDTMVPTAK
jgi:hypothetical protein